MNLVSVIVPYYNKKIYIYKTVKSILRQSYQNFEIIIIYDDDKEDIALLEKVVKLDKRIFLIRNSKNIGAGLSRNKGIKISRGNFIAFLDSDDIWHSDKLKKQLMFMKKNNSDFSFTAYDIIDSKGKKIGSRQAKYFLNYDNLVKSCDIGLSTVILKRKLFNNYCRFPNLKTKEDYVYWLKLAKKGIEMYGLNRSLTKWRATKNSLSSNSKQKILDAFLVYRKYLDFSLIKSLWCVIVLSSNYIFKKYR